MGLRQLAKMIEEARQQVVVGVLTAALAAMGGTAACSNTDGGGGGLPASDAAAQDGLADPDGKADAAQPDAQDKDAGAGSTDVATDAVQPKDSGPVMLYGPQPVDAGPTDAAADTVDIKPDSGPVTFYGPIPVDAGPVDGGADIQDSKSDGGPAMLYGPLPVDAGPADVQDAGCDPVAIYGPKPCQDDAECDTEQSPGWYCDKGNSFDDGCGGTITWPICKAP